MDVPTLTKLRGLIDSIDEQIIALLVKRIELSNEIMQAKPPGRVVDADRERAITRRYQDGLGAKSTPEKAERVALSVLGASLIYPSR